MAHDFDLIVIGTGTAAGNIAGRCRKAGWSVAVIDELPFGGTCALRGCDPKKMLRRGPEIVDAARRLAGQGIEPEGHYAPCRRNPCRPKVLTENDTDRLLGVHLLGAESSEVINLFALATRSGLRTPQKKIRGEIPKL